MPSDEAGPRTPQDALRTWVVLCGAWPPPGTGHVTGAGVAYDDARDVVVAAAVVLVPATLDVVAENPFTGVRSARPTSSSPSSVG